MNILLSLAILLFFALILAVSSRMSSLSLQLERIIEQLNHAKEREEKVLKVQNLDQLQDI